MVVFEDGQPANGAYRRFQIKTVDGPNDFASLQEVLAPLLAPKAAEEDPAGAAKGWTKLPDLVIIDGGKGQLNAGLEVLQKLGLRAAADRLAGKENEEIFLPDSSEPVVLPRDSQALYLVQRIRDEAHRFAITYHRKVRERRSVRSRSTTCPASGRSASARC